MAGTFDPRSWSPLRTVGLGRLVPGRWDPWGTLALLDPLADLSAGTVTALLPDMLMTLLGEAVRSRFGGRELTATLRGDEVTATLGTLEVGRRGAYFRTETVLTQLRWNDYALDEMTVVAHGVRLIPGVPTRVRAAHVDITGTMTTATLVAWLNQRQSTWELGIDADTGLFTVRHRHRRITALVDATIRENLLTVAVARVSWHGIRMPRQWIRIAPVPLTDLPHRATVARADRNGDRVHIRIDIPEVSGSFDLAQIRSAILTGSTLIVF